ncbi:hypothetical protein ACFQZ4_00450 [Catellatospora coxensis]
MDGGPGRQSDCAVDGSEETSWIRPHGGVSLRPTRESDSLCVDLHFACSSRPCPCSPPARWPCPSPAAAATPRVVDLGTLGGACCSTATAVNDNGVVVGYSGAPSQTAPMRAFRWKNGVMTDIGSLGARAPTRPTSTTTAGSSASARWPTTSRCTRSCGGPGWA